MRSDLDRIRDINEALERIAHKLPRQRMHSFSRTCTRSGFSTTFRLIGEAANGISPGFREAHGTIPWKKVIAMRHLLVHQYFGIDLDEVWNTTQQDLPRAEKRDRPDRTRTLIHTRYFNEGEADLTPATLIPHLAKWGVTNVTRSRSPLRSRRYPVLLRHLVLSSLVPLGPVQRHERRVPTDPKGARSVPDTARRAKISSCTSARPAGPCTGG